MASNRGQIKLWGRKSFPLAIILLLLFAGLQNWQNLQNKVFSNPTLDVSTVGQQEILNAQAQQARRAEVTVEARVCKILPDDTRGIPHQRFLIRLINGSTVLVAHDTKLAPRVPIREGDLVRIHGEYIFNEKGGVLHFTHKSFNGRHEGGWIDFNGARYQ